jgi:hypothetical protein
MPSFMRLKQRRSVDFPHPDGPMTDVMAWAGTLTLMFLSAWKVP